VPLVSDLCNDVAISDTVLQRRRLAVSYGSGPEAAFLAAWLTVVSSSAEEQCALHTTSSSVFYASLTADGTSMSEGLDVRDSSLVGTTKPFTLSDLAAFEAAAPEKQRAVLESLHAGLQTSVEEYILASCATLFALPVGKYIEQATGGADKVVVRHSEMLHAAERCLACIRDGEHDCAVPACKACERDRRPCASCTRAGFMHWHRDGRACVRCRAASRHCVRAAVLLTCSDQLADNQRAFEEMQPKYRRVPRPIAFIFGKVHFVKNLRGMPCVALSRSAMLCSCADSPRLCCLSCCAQAISRITGSRRAAAGCASSRWRSCAGILARSAGGCKSC
jgi:hypothetical protein